MGVGVAGLGPADRPTTHQLDNENNITSPKIGCQQGELCFWIL